MRSPTGFSSRTAACAAATERSRPSVMGKTVPGNTTMFLTGTMISMSSGSAGAGTVVPPAGPSGARGSVVMVLIARPCAD